MKGTDRMEQRTRKQNTWLFIGFLLLGSIMHYFDPTENLFLNSFLFSGRFTIFAGLVLFWIQSVRARLLPTRVRIYYFSGSGFLISKAISHPLILTVQRKTGVIV